MRMTGLLPRIIMRVGIVVVSGLGPRQSMPSSVIGTPLRIDLGVTDGYKNWVNLPEASADGIKRYNAYFAWRDLEPAAGTYTFQPLDEVIQEATSAGVRVALEIEITDVSCTEPGLTDEECIGTFLPEDMSFSRYSSRFDEPRFARRLGKLIRTIMRRYDPEVLTHVYAGNEVDSYVRMVRWADHIDLYPGYLRLMKRINGRVNRLPGPRAKFGTALTFYAFPEFYEDLTKMSRVVEVLGLTIYPTDPEWGQTDSIDERVRRWFDAAVQVTEGRRTAITETGDSALAPFGSLDSQQQYARYVLNYLRANPGAFEYASWFSMYDNPPLAGTFFEGMGLRSLQGQKRPAYYQWAQQ